MTNTKLCDTILADIAKKRIETLKDHIKNYEKLLQQEAMTYKTGDLVFHKDYGKCFINYSYITSLEEPFYTVTYVNEDGETISVNANPSDLMKFNKTVRTLYGD